MIQTEEMGTGEIMCDFPLDGTTLISTLMTSLMEMPSVEVKVLTAVPLTPVLGKSLDILVMVALRSLATQTPQE